MRKSIVTILWLLLNFVLGAQDTISFDYHGLTWATHGTMKEFYLHKDGDTLDVHFFEFHSKVLGYQREFQRNKRWSLVMGLDGIQFKEKLRTVDSIDIGLSGQGLMASVKGRFFYFKRPRFQLFSGFGMSAANYWITRSRSPFEGEEIGERTNVFRTRLNLDIIGMRQSISKRWALQFVIGTGKVPIRFGLNYRLNEPNSFVRSSRKNEFELNNNLKKGSVQVSYSFGRMFEGSFLSSQGISANLWLEKFVRDQFSLGVFTHVSRGLYFMDDFSSLSNGYGPSKLTNRYEYKATQVHNLQLSFRATKYQVLSPRWNLFYGMGLGLRGRFLPNGELTTSGSMIVPLAINAYCGVQLKINSNFMLLASSGLIPNMLQIGLKWKLVH